MLIGVIGNTSDSESEESRFDPWMSSKMFWDNTFSPTMQKHRDFEHSDFFTHELDNGGTYVVVSDVIMVDQDPITGSLFDPPRKYYLVEFTLHNGETYPYLVPAEADGSKPNQDNVKRTIIGYVKNPVEGGRRYTDYIAEDDNHSSFLDTLGIKQHNTTRRSVFFSIDDVL